jgi:hypothetical protein
VNRSCSGIGPIITLDRHESSSSPGFYLYRIISISDSKFPERKLDHETIEFVQQIFPLPKPSISHVQEKNGLINTNIICVDPPGPDVKNIKIGPFTFDFLGNELQGSESPVSIDVELLSDKGKVINIQTFEWKSVIKKYTFEIAIPTDQYLFGIYHVKISRVTNTFGCVWKPSAKDFISQNIKNNIAWKVEIAPKPTFNFVQESTRFTKTYSIEKEELYNLEKYFCVGDIAKIELRLKVLMFFYHRLFPKQNSC